MKKFCNFRPLCWLALMAVVEIAACLVAWWLVVLLAGVGLILLAVLKLPRRFKIGAIILFVAVALSFALTTALNPHPQYRTYAADAGLRGVILRYADWYLHCFLSDANADLMFAMLFGNKAGLPLVLKSDFTAAGLAHMLVVSGLHVGVLAGVLSLILRWCKVPRRHHLWVLTPVLLFYAYLCRWQYAILRAVIMFLVYAFARNNLHVADPLSTLALAMLVILVLFPYAVVSASFWLSFACVLGIDLFYQPIYRVCPVKTLALYVAVTLGSFPFLVYYFGVVPLYAVLANVILVPLLIAAFVVSVLAVGTFAAGAVLWVLEPILNFVRSVSGAIAQLPFSLLPVTSAWPAIMVYLLGLVLISRFIFLPRKVKYPAAAVLFACYFVLIVI